MKYTKPEIETMQFDLVDVIQTSATDLPGEGGSDIEDGGQYETPIL
ncbi:MAG: hypothetical protein IJD91_04070 [Clostridia bacterium]|nr:hypothetical protein [Clostridia bacterium]